MSDILSLARSRQSKLECVPMGVLETIALADNAFNGFSSSVDLSEAGHSFDKKIGYGLIAAVAIGATLVTAGAAAPAAAAATGSTAAAGGAATTAGAIGASTGTVIAADTVTDIAATAYTTHKINKLAKASKKAYEAKQFIDNVRENIDSTKKYNQEIGEKTGMQRGIIETSVGWITEFFAKPARQRAVDNYINGTLIPEFRQQILSVSSSLFRDISSLLRQEAFNSSESTRANLSSLKTSLIERKEEHNAKINMYKQYLNKLNEI